jgi:N-acetylglucosaminyl-diphospho-decaprenol L-rhamnosyltransferase
MQVLIVTVTHNSAAVLPAFLDGVAALARAGSIGVRLVDNASRDETVALARAAIAQRGLGSAVELLPQPDNPGWAAGNNRGLRDAPASEFCLLLNPDVTIAPADLEALCDALRADPAAGAAVPRLRTASGARVPVFPWPTLGDAVLGVCGWRRWRTRALQRSLAAGTGTRELREGYAEGSCLLLRRAALQAIGPLDERFWLFFDDVDLGRSLQRAGLRTLLVAGAHASEMAAKGSRAAPGAGAAEERLARFLAHLRSELRYYDKWHGPRTARALASYKRWFELGLRSASWRLRYGVRGLARRGREIAREALGGDV